MLQLYKRQMLRFVIVVMSLINGTPNCHGIFDNVQEALQVGKSVRSAVIELAEIEIPG
eukprot:COSAG05_NODE_3906_length_1778_cov_1.757143_1_plen_58_part_00